MKVTFVVKPHVLNFRFEAGTSRGSFSKKPTWYIYATDSTGRTGIGEASPLKGLSIDYSDNYEQVLLNLLSTMARHDLPEDPDELLNFLHLNVSANLPSMHFGIETCLLDLLQGGKKEVIPGPFYEGLYRIPINGLIWMGSEQFMQEQIEEKLKAGFSTIKMKIGAIDIKQELSLLAKIRDHYSVEEIGLRVDANGAFDQSNVREVLQELSSLDVHSIEQPVAKGEHVLMSQLCAEHILPIALDEELIGINDRMEKLALLDTIKPHFIILKPSLVGGILHTREWIEIAEAMNIGWWMTSMLESNIGLNAIAQLAAQYKPTIPQGLGTGQLYDNNWESPLEIRKGELLYNQPQPWANAFDQP